MLVMCYVRFFCGIYVLICAAWSFHEIHFCVARLTAHTVHAYTQSNTYRAYTHTLINYFWNFTIVCVLLFIIVFRFFLYVILFVCGPFHYKHTYPNLLHTDQLASPSIFGEIKLPTPIPTEKTSNGASLSGGVLKDEYQTMFSNSTKAIVWGMQTRAVQSMLDFDFICR